MGARVDSIILHYTGLREDALDAWTADPFGEALRWMLNPVSQVSSHYIIGAGGRIVQLVPEAMRAWHAGRGSWKDCCDLNSCSIGIEIANTGHAGGLPPYPQPQIDAVIALCKAIIARYAIMPERILAHSDIAPDRKADPGEHFPWEALFYAGVGLWVKPGPLSDGPVLAQGDENAEVLALQQKLAQYGYGVAASGIYDLAAQTVVRAFQRHFRPGRVDGVADPSTLATLDRLIAACAAATAQA